MDEMQTDRQAVLDCFQKGIAFVDKLSSIKDLSDIDISKVDNLVKSNHLMHLWRN